MKFTIALVAAFSVAEAYHFKSGAVTGFEKFTYGKFITRMKAPNKKGTVASFFTYWNGQDFYPEGWNELDIEIVPSVEQNPLSMNIIYGDGETKRESHDYQAKFDPKDDWHIYELAWTPDFIAWTVDNKEVRRVEKTDPSVKFTTKPQSVMMNFWTPTFQSWGKDFDPVDMPWFVEYDYVETYTYNSETSGFDFHWRDNFTTFDTNRWHKADNTTFDANSTTFRASQTTIKDGHLVFKMEPDHPQNVHGTQKFQPTEVQPVRTEPIPVHAGKAGQKPIQGDKHYDVGAEQHYSSMQHDLQFDHQQPFADHYLQPPPHSVYANPHQSLYEYSAPYAYGEHMDAYGRHVDPYSAQAYHQAPYQQAYHYYEQPYAMPHHAGVTDPYHLDQFHYELPPPQTPLTPQQAQTQQKPPQAPQQPKTQMPPKQQQQPLQPQQQPQVKQQQQQPSIQGKLAANFAKMYIDEEKTPFEHSHYEDPIVESIHHEYQHGYEHGQDHVYRQYSEHYGQHYYEEPNHEGEYRTYEDQYGDHHADHHIDQDFKHDSEGHTYHEGDTYGHDVDYHAGTSLKHDIEHSFDELYHDLEQRSEHGVEHSDIHYSTSDFGAREEPHHETEDIKSYQN